MPSAGGREKLHSLEGLASENHCSGRVEIVVVEFQCSGTAAGAVNAPGVGNAVWTAEAEMTFFALVVAAESLIDVIVVVAAVSQGAERDVAFVDKTFALLLKSVPTAGS